MVTICKGNKDFSRKSGNKMITHNAKYTYKICKSCKAIFFTHFIKDSVKDFENRLCNFIDFIHSTLLALMIDSHVSITAR